ncbi:unnamed protein product [Phytophthora fragariaefolia]|uniref:Unnamed protein product n=1 Tax=Phytophthora fragariaefolia TaxID=1490495 RepID=A0A9W7D529_9STRA|nr:unnamed protein product [Phytophthora fragariaefolia]
MSWKLKSAASWFTTVLVGVLLSTTNSQQVGTNCSEPRIRRSWDAYNVTEKALYLEAVGVAMDRGFQLKFVQLHVEYMSELEAHRNCMFIYWHRMMLLGYENMLRSLDPKYRCLTLPYWDHLSGTARKSAGTCSNMWDCTAAITDSGSRINTLTGRAGGLSQSLKIYDTVIRSTASSTVCTNGDPVSHFCGNNTVCAKCMIRSLKAPSYPADAFFGSVYKQIFTSSVYDTFRSYIEQGVHSKLA